MPRFATRYATDCLPATPHHLLATPRLSTCCATPSYPLRHGWLPAMPRFPTCYATGQMACTYLLRHVILGSWKDMNFVLVVDDPRSDCTYFDQIIEGFLELLAKLE